MHGVAVLGFLAAVAPITMSPGTSLTLIVSRVATAGRRHGWWIIAGTITGLYVQLATAHAAFVALWLGGWTTVSQAGARLLRTEGAKAAINRAGGTILVALGLRAATS